MTAKEIIEFNVLCGNFCYPNAKAEFDSGNISIEEGMLTKTMLILGDFDLMKFHSDWNLIMLVATKIYNTKCQLQQGDTTFQTFKGDIVSKIGVGNKELAILAIDKFLKWYNKL
jgi:hypothetical protein